MKAHFRDDELKRFNKIGKELESYKAYIQNLYKNLNINRINRQRFHNVIRNYFHFYSRRGETKLSEADIKDIYEQIDSDLEEYLTARDLLLTTGAVEIVPALINVYSYLSFLMYSAGAENAADTITRDTMDIITTMLSKEEGKRYYRENKLNVRDAIILMRDLVLYVRENCQAEGVKDPMNTIFSSEGLDNTLKYFSDKGKFSDDISSNGQVNLYNLWRQMDRWSGKELGLPESILVPDFVPSRNMKGNSLSETLGIRCRYVKAGRDR